MAIKMVTVDIEAGAWDHHSALSLSPDRWFKYGCSGTGAYSIHLPCQVLDGPFLVEPHHTTFVNYLRLCFQWGGFPGVSSDPGLLQEERAFLTRYMLLF